MAVKLIIDAASDLTMEQAKELGVTLIPMTVRFGKDEYRSGVDISNEEFYNRLTTEKELPTTSQPTPFDFEEEYQKVAEAEDEAVVLCVSSALSGTYQSACIAAEEFPGKVRVIDGKSVAIGTAILAEFALSLLEKGLSAEEIEKEILKKRDDIIIVALIVKNSKLLGCIGKVFAAAFGYEKHIFNSDTEFTRQIYARLDSYYVTVFYIVF